MSCHPANSIKSEVVNELALTIGLSSFFIRLLLDSGAWGVAAFVPALTPDNIFLHFCQNI